MRFPLPVINDLSNDIVEIWKSVYEPSRGTFSDKTTEESLWRRSQDPSNKEYSGWKSDIDKRRKLFYYQYHYDLFNDKLTVPFIGLKSLYIYLCLSFPEKELIEYNELILKFAKIGGWKISTKTKHGWSANFGDLLCEAVIYDPASLNRLDNTKLPDTYSSLELTFKSSNFLVDENIKQKPWAVLATGLRKKEIPGKAEKVNDMNKILDFLPAQLEIGCGPAYEAGVPALHDLHYLYSINDPFTKQFIFHPEKDNFLENIFKNPLQLLLECSSVFKSMITAPTTVFYKILAKLYERKALVGPIITNNFDGIHLRLNIPELCVRKFEDNYIFPTISFHPSAKSLLVIGCHADRRGIQKQAREKGLKVIVIDPEGWEIDKKFIEYPLESQQDNDIVINNTAEKGISDLMEIINKTGVIFS